MPSATAHAVRRESLLRRLFPAGPVPLGLLITLAVLTVAAWTATVYEARAMNVPIDAALRGGAAGAGAAGMAMGGMSAAGWSLADAGAFVAVWSVMMAAMMLPAVLPMLVFFSAVQAGRGRLPPVRTWIFAAGYLAVWSAVGVVVYAVVQLAGEFGARFTPAGRELWAPLVLGASLAVAGIYQFTPLKRACLTQCRSPMAFVMQHWRDGLLGALAMGLRHGAYCLGCCWALFAVLVAAGTMSIAWMLLLTLVVFAEKVLPHGRRTAALIGIVFVGLGVVVAGGGASTGFG